MRYNIGKGTLNARVERVWLHTDDVAAAASSALSSTTCDDSTSTENSCSDVVETGNSARPSTFIGDWQGVIGFNVNF